MLEIMLNNLLSLPGDLLNDFIIWWHTLVTSITGSNFLNFLLFNPLIWIIIGSIVYILRRGKGCISTPLFLLFLWLVLKMAAISLGIEIIFGLIVIIIIIPILIQWKRGMN